MGNIRSVEKSLLRIGSSEIKILSEPSNLKSCTKIILPGVGHFAQGMKNLIAKDWIKHLEECIIEKKIPILGICLGMQLLTEYSEEGDVEGLGFIKGKTQKFNPDIIPRKLSLPQMGWNSILSLKVHPLIHEISIEDTFYFVHNYFVTTTFEDETIATTKYGTTYSSIIGKNNILGVQFHPEKSHNSGLKILKNFLDIKS